MTEAESRFVPEEDYGLHRGTVEADRARLGLKPTMQSAQLEKPQRIIKTHNLTAHHNTTNTKNAGGDLQSPKMNRRNVVEALAGPQRHKSMQTLKKRVFDVNFRGI